MRKIWLLLCVVAAPLYAQDDTSDVQEDEFVMMPTKKPSNSTDIRNWLFAGASLAAATIAVVLVAYNPGSKPPPGHRTFPQ